MVKIMKKQKKNTQVCDNVIANHLFLQTAALLEEHISRLKTLFSLNIFPSTKR